MTISNNTQAIHGGGTSPSYNELEILQMMDKVKNHNLELVTETASVQLDFESVQEKAALASKKAVDANAAKLRRLSALTAITGVLSSLAAGFASAGSTVGISGVSQESMITGLKSFAGVLGNGVLPVAEGVTTGVQAKATISIGDNNSKASIAGNLMQGLDNSTSEAASTFSGNMESSAQITGKEELIISNERNSKMYR